MTISNREDAYLYMSMNLISVTMQGQCLVSLESSYIARHVEFQKYDTERYQVSYI